MRLKWSQTRNASRHLTETKANPLKKKKAIHPKPLRIPTSNFSVAMTNTQAKISKHTRTDRLEGRGKSKKNTDPKSKLTL